MKQSTPTSTSIRRQEPPRQQQQQQQQQPPSTPPPLRSSSARPIPPWPVSPASNEYASYSSPDASATTPLDPTTPVCPGAPKKKRYPPQRRSFREDEEDDDEHVEDDDDMDPEDHRTSMFQRGFRPRRLDFGSTDEDPDQAAAGFPILRMGSSSQPSSPSRIRHDDQDCPVLGLRPSPGKRGTTTTRRKLSP